MNLFDLQARITLDDSSYQKGIAAAGGLVKDFAKVSAAAFGAATAGVGAFVKESISAYGEYEQLYGGLVTLYEDLAWDVEQNANKAFKTAGMSVNEYMETAMSFSASLNQSLMRTEGNIRRSADLTDTAITDMADNANKMGTSIESIQTAYAGFAKQNYTMLDNLKLGYGGTKTEMERLLEDAEKLTGVHYDIENFSDIIEGIHAIQENLGITGTTAKEASETIQGSISSMKAAWSNLKLEISKDDGNVELAFETLAETAGTVFDNIMPRIEKSLDGIGDLIVKAAPSITKGLTKMIPKVIPPLLKASTSLIKSFVSAIPQVIASIPDLASTIFNDVVKPLGDEIFTFMPDWLGSDIKKIFSSMKDMVGNIDFSKTAEAFSGLADSVEPLAENLSGGIAWAFENVLKPFGEWLMNEALPPAIDALSSAFDILGSTLDFLEVPAKAVWEEFLKPLAENIGDFTWGSLDLLAKGLGAIAEEIDGVDWSGFWMNFDEFGDNWKTGAKGIADFLDENFDTIKEFFSESEFGSSWFEFWEKTGELIQTSATGWIAFFDTTIQWIKDFAEGWVKEFGYIGEAVDELAGKLSSLFSGDLGEWLYDKLHPEDIPALGDGGHVSRPTFAIVGEKEPETIIPDSKLKYLGGNNITVNLNVEGGLSSDYDTDRLVERLSEKLAELNIMQTRAIGGTGYNG